MLRTNYRCVQLLYISVDVAKYVQNVHKFTQYTHFLSVTKNYLSSLNNLFMVRFQLIRKSSYAKNKLQMCSVTQHQCRCRQMCGKCSQIHPVHSLFVCYKKWLVLTEQSIHFNVSTHYRMSSYAKNKLLMCSVIQHQCRRRQMCGNFHKFTKYTHFLSVTKMTCLDWTIYSWKDFNSFGSPLMLRTNYSCVQSLNISVDVAK